MPPRNTLSLTPRPRPGDVTIGTGNCANFPAPKPNCAESGRRAPGSHSPAWADRNLKWQKEVRNMPITAQTPEQRALIESQMDANFKANMERLIAENTQLKADLSLAAKVDLDQYRAAIAEAQRLRNRLEAIDAALSGWYDDD